MINTAAWLPMFLNALHDHFGNRVWFVGLQGSYSRNEATESSDIDPVVILDNLSVSDIHTYDAMLNTLPNRDLICGFLSGKKELLNWEPSDLLHLCCDTTPIKGSLDELLPLIDASSVDRAIKIGACNIYHACVHNMLHRKSEHTLRGLYKSASFVIQSICFKETGRFIRHQSDLFNAVSPAEQNILTTFSAIKNGCEIDFDSMSAILFSWVQRWIQ